MYGFVLTKKIKNMYAQISPHSQIYPWQFVKNYNPIYTRIPSFFCNQFPLKLLRHKHTCMYINTHISIHYAPDVLITILRTLCNQ